MLAHTGSILLQAYLRQIIDTVPTFHQQAMELEILVNLFLCRPHTLSVCCAPSGMVYIQLALRC